MTADQTTLYRTVVRITGTDHRTQVAVVIPAWDPHRRVVLTADRVPPWLMTKEVGYRFFARVPILAEDIDQIRLVDCENDPRTPEEQVGALREWESEVAR